MMNAMAEQHFDLGHGRVPHMKTDTNAIITNPAIGYSMPPPAEHHQISQDIYSMSSYNTTHAAPGITSLPQIIFSSSASSSSATAASGGNFNSHLPKPSIYTLRDYSSSSDQQPFSRSAPNLQDTLQINTSLGADHSADALSVGSVTPLSMHSKNSFSSFTDMRFPDSTDSLSQHPNAAEGNYTKEPVGSIPVASTRPTFETAQWIETNRQLMNQLEHPTNQQSHAHSPYLQHPTNMQPQQQHFHPQISPIYRTSPADQPSSELTDQQVKNLLHITKSTSSSTGKRKPRMKPDSITKPEEGFVCEYCGKTFAKGYNLKSHLKTHSDDRPFQCSFCDRSFARNHDKKRHELLHQGVKKFQCGGVLKDKVTRWGCGKRFSRADGLGRHFRTDIGWLCIRPLMLEAKEQERQESEKTKEVDETTFGTSFINELLKKAQ